MENSGGEEIQLLCAIFSALIYISLRPPKTRVRGSVSFFFFYYFTTTAFHVIVKGKSLKKKIYIYIYKRKKKTHLAKKTRKVVKNYMYWPTASARNRIKQEKKKGMALLLLFRLRFSIVCCGVSFFLFSRGGKNIASHNNRVDIGNHRTRNVTNSTGTLKN